MREKNSFILICSYHHPSVIQNQKFPAKTQRMTSHNQYVTSHKNVVLQNQHVSNHVQSKNQHMTSQNRPNTSQQNEHVTSQNPYMTSQSSTPKKPRKVEIVRVCLVKNPTFGIHVHDSGEFMGESGVLIMRVQKGGSAEGKVRVGDKILMVSFCCIYLYQCFFTPYI